MAINGIPISRRTLPFDPQTTANGSFTLPRFAFIPSPALQQLSGVVVMAPTLGGLTPSAFAAPPQLNRPYPVPVSGGIYGIRMANTKTSPG